MDGFSEVTMTWNGEQYTVPADDQLMLVARIESAIRRATGMQALPALLQAGGPDYAALSMAFGAALRHAGADVSDSEIYLSIQADMADQQADVAIKVQSSVMALVSIISPPVGSKLRGESTGKKKRAATKA